MTGGPGFEPGLSESESDVLPLDDPPNLGAILALRVLGSLTSLSQPYLLALDFSSIASYKTSLS